MRVCEPRKKVRVRRSMMEGHHITDTKLIKDETSANTGTRGHYTDQAIWTQQEVRGSLHNICWQDREGLWSQPCIGDGQNLYWFKRQLDNSAGKKPPMSCDVSTDHTIKRKHHCVFALCSSLVATIGHERRKMMHRQQIFVWRIK